MKTWIESSILIKTQSQSLKDHLCLNIFARAVFDRGNNSRFFKKIDELYFSTINWNVVNLLGSEIICIDFGHPNFGLLNNSKNFKKEVKAIKNQIVDSNYTIKLIQFKKAKKQILENFRRLTHDEASNLFNTIKFEHQEPIDVVKVIKTIRSVTLIDILAFLKKTKKFPKFVFQNFECIYSINHETKNLLLSNHFSKCKKYYLKDNICKFEIPIILGDAIQDLMACEVFNFLLGGSFNSIIYKGFRENKGWAYDCYSTLNFSSCSLKIIVESSSIGNPKIFKTMNKIVQRLLCKKISKKKFNDFKNTIISNGEILIDGKNSMNSLLFVLKIAYNINNIREYYRLFKNLTLNDYYLYIKRFHNFLLTEKIFD